MDLRLHLLAVLLVIMALVEAGTSLSIPTSDLEDEAKDSQVTICLSQREIILM